MKLKSIPLFFTLLCLVPAAQAASSWEGLVTLKLTLPTAGTGYQLINYTSHKGKIRVDLLGGDYGSKIIDFEKNELITIAPGGKTYTRQPLAPAPALPPGAQVEKAATSEPIKGHSTSHYTVRVGTTRAEVWLANDMPADFSQLMDGAPWAVALAGKNGMLLRASIYEGTAKPTRLEPESVQLMRLHDEDFVPPPDAKEVAASPAAPKPPAAKQG